MTIRILQGDCRDVLLSLPEQSVHCVVTSPPYYSLRDYQVAGQIGLESSPEKYISELVWVFRAVRPVMRNDATCWLNLGDCTIKKQLQMIPAQVALALRADGWYLRSHIIWHKPNPMPESVTDRPTSAHESIFLLTKKARYYYDADAVREQSGDWPGHDDKPQGSFNGKNGSAAFRAIREHRNLRNVWTIATQPYSGAHFATFPPDLIEPCIKAGTSEKGCCAKCGAPWVRDVARDTTRSEIAPTSEKGVARANGSAPYRGNSKETGGVAGLSTSITVGWSRGCYCAGYENPVPCTVLDPFGGAGTTGLVADRLQRNAILIELNPEYAALARARLQSDAGMFAEVA